MNNRCVFLTNALASNSTDAPERLDDLGSVQDGLKMSSDGHLSPLIQELVEALEKIERVPEARKSSGYLHDCPWCNGSAAIASAALASARKGGGV